MIDEIQKLAEERQHLVATGGDPTEVARLTRKLEYLYEEKRSVAAHARDGRSRTEIVRQARVESELERLITR